MKNVVKEIEELEAFEVTSVNESELTVNFTATFKEPYLLGLLNKKSDLLTFEVKNETDEATTLLILNVTGEEMASNTTTKRIEMQFDFRSKLIEVILYRSKDEFHEKLSSLPLLHYDSHCCHIVLFSILQKCWFLTTVDFIGIHAVSGLHAPVQLQADSLPL